MVGHLSWLVETVETPIVAVAVVDVGNGSGDER